MSNYFIIILNEVLIKFGSMKKAARNGVRLLLPIDVVVADENSNDNHGEIVSVRNISPRHRIVDVGPQTTKNFREELQRCETVFWNGPMGIYETPQFAEGTEAMARLLANLQATTILGGGSTAEIATNMNLADKMTFISTGGGASMKFLSGETLPGVEALLDKK